ncbi:MAG: N-6 DNA methylase, partial [Candidatus Kuenenia stuttgartiensis]|nr:N-6 DNA methylase [Candidatus Kuenenia stuttgartiensis]
QIFTQQECLSIPAIAEAFVKNKPENVVKVSEKIYYIIEAKNEREKLDIAVKEARDYYGKPINKIGKVQALFITGIAGNQDDGFIAQSQYFNNGTWETITENDADVTGLLSKSQVEKILATKSAHIKDVEISEQEFLKTAEEINGILHEGGIHKDIRARVISAILLALSEGTQLNLDEEPSVLIKSINSRIDVVLQRHNKSAFSQFISLTLPATEENHFRFKKAIVETIHELLGLNIRSAMKSGKDILGTFYEVFLKYGNGAKEIGIVLTPRHITKFAAEVLDIQYNDLVLDPTCGTGGFLVAALDEVRKKATESELDSFKRYGIYGMEEQDFVVSLALVNMIFRNDGKNNIIPANCFAEWLYTKSRNGRVKAEYSLEDSEDRIPPITKVLMNPPFPKKKTDNKEFKFVEHALKQMQDGGILFSVLPYSCMIKSGSYLEWRKRLLKSNTLLSVVTFPDDLFYPVGVHTAGIFIMKGKPHPVDQKVLWFRATHDGRLKKKGKRLENPRAQDDFPKVTPILKKFIFDQRISIPSIPMFQKAEKIDFSDSDLELAPEAYLDETAITQGELDENIEQSMRDNIAFKIRFEKQLRQNGGNSQPSQKAQGKQKTIATKSFGITELFSLERGHFHALDKLEKGNYMTVSRVSDNNGVVGFYEKPKRAKVYPAGTMTVSTVTGDAFIQYAPFIATDNVVMCIPLNPLRETTLIYIQVLLNKSKWRYSYGRQCYKGSFEKTIIELPVNGDTLDEDYMESIVTKQPYWSEFKERILS